MSGAGTPRVYGGVTGEQRIAERRRKLIDAGMDLFGSGGSELVRVKDVVAEAGLTERYFYESFSDLGALFNAVLDLAMEDVEVAVNAAVVDAPGDGFAHVSVALRAAIDQLVKDPRTIRIIFIEALGRGGRAGSRRNEILVRATDNFLRWSGAEPSVIEGSSKEDRMKAFALAGAAAELLISWAEGLLDVSSSSLGDFLVGLYWRMNLP